MKSYKTQSVKAIKPIFFKNKKFSLNNKIVEGFKLNKKSLKVIKFQSWTKFTGVPFFVFETFSYMEALALPIPLNFTQKKSITFQVFLNKNSNKIW